MNRPYAGRAAARTLGQSCGPLPSLAAKATAAKMRGGGRLYRNTLSGTLHWVTFRNCTVQTLNETENLLVFRKVLERESNLPGWP